MNQLNRNSSLYLAKKKLIEDALNFRLKRAVPHPDLGDYVAEMSTMLTDRVLVLAEHSRQATDFARKMRRRPNTVTFVNRGDYLCGLDNLSVVRLGPYMNHSYAQEIDLRLRTRRNMDVWTIWDW